MGENYELHLHSVVASCFPGWPERPRGAQQVCADGHPTHPGGPVMSWAEGFCWGVFSGIQAPTLLCWKDTEAGSWASLPKTTPCRSGLWILSCHLDGLPKFQWPSGTSLGSQEVVRAIIPTTLMEGQTLAGAFLYFPKDLWRSHQTWAISSFGV